MRKTTILALLLLAPALAAQEAPAEPPEAEAPAADDAALLRQVDALLGPDEAKRKEAREALRGVSAERLLDLLARRAATVERHSASQKHVRAVVAPEIVLAERTGTEVICGADDGVGWTLKSLGGGRYQLEATRRDESGAAVESYAGEGTLKELQARFAFLKGLFLVQVATPQTYRGRFVREDVMLAGVPAVPPPGAVGLVVEPPSEELRFHLNIPAGAGLLVRDVVAGSRAEALGIRRFDILLKLDGELIDTPAQLKRLHEAKGALDLLRRGEMKRIDLAAESR